jgi:GAF domain-containing protein
LSDFFLEYTGEPDWLPFDRSVVEYPGELVEAFLGLSPVNLTDGTDLESLLVRVADLAVEQLEGCDMAGVTMMGVEGPSTIAFTDAVAPEIDVAQYRTGQGPCVAAFRTCTILRIDDTADDDRWPEFAAAARAHGVHSTLSLPLQVEDQPLGALNLYSRSVGTFEHSEPAAVAFVTLAASILANAQAFWAGRALTEQLEEALLSRPAIEQAKGVLMREHGCDADQAFEILRQNSQAANRKVRDLAAEIVDEAVAGERPSRVRSRRSR